MKKILNVFFSLSLLLFAETSVFNNKGIESKKVYGFSETEQYIYDNKKELNRLRTRLYTAEEKISSLKTSQSGFKNIIRGNSQKISKLTKQINLIIKESKRVDQIIKNIEVQVADLGLELETLKKDNTQQKVFNTTVKENDKKFESKTVEILTILDNLKKTVVTQEELKSVVKKILEELEKNRKENIELQKALKYSNPALFFKSQKPKDIIAKALDFLKKKNYNEARIRLFYVLNDTEYKRAKTLYNIGELEYMEGRYKEASDSFKASGALDNKAYYMPTLLYHAGISYQKLKDKKNAVKFFNMLIKLYPKSNLIKGAKTRVKELSK